MNSFIYIHLTDKINFDYQNHIIPKVKEKFPDYVIFDFDNFSGKDLIKYAAGLIDSSEKTILYIHVGSAAVAGSIRNFLETVIKNKHKITVYVEGYAVFIERMLAPSGIVINYETKEFCRK
ncbi:MAG: hypothetical protein ACK40G_14265 [Cytophagaceae bacterium]